MTYFVFIRLYYIKNGLEVASKSFKEIEQIYLLEFIENDEKLLIIGKGLKKEGPIFAIWDLYNTGKVESIEIDNFPITIMENYGTHLARSSGNILQIGDDGKVSSVLKEIEKEMIRQRLMANNWNQRRTAADLGMAKSTLHDRIRAYGIKRPDEPQSI